MFIDVYIQRFSMIILRKIFVFILIKVEELEDGMIGKLSGYGFIFGNVDSYGEVVDKGVFIKLIN